MEAELRKRWVAALRSGKYRQAKGTLRRRRMRNGVPSMCCLGVLCDIVDNTKWLDTKGDRGGAAYGSYSVKSMPTGTFMHNLGLSEDVATTLATMNDRGKSFAYIADYIERNDV